MLRTLAEISGLLELNCVEDVFYITQDLALLSVILVTRERSSWQISAERPQQNAEEELTCSGIGMSSRPNIMPNSLCMRSRPTFYYGENLIIRVTETKSDEKDLEVSVVRAFLEVFPAVTRLLCSSNRIFKSICFQERTSSPAPYRLALQKCRETIKSNTKSWRPRFYPNQVLRPGSLVLIVKKTMDLSRMGIDYRELE
ncbi:hypothetical protein Tco_0071478 [Tanacetum coccineum]